MMLSDNEVLFEQTKIVKQVILLMIAARDGDFTAIGCKEELRNRIECKRDAVKKEWEPLEELRLGMVRRHNQDVTFDLHAMVEYRYQSLCLAAQALSGLTPRNRAGWRQDWTVRAAEPLKRLQKLQNELAPKSKVEWTLYLHIKIVQAVLFADAVALLDQWCKGNDIEKLRRGIKTRDKELTKLNKDIEKLREEAGRRRVNAKDQA